MMKSDGKSSEGNPVRSVDKALTVLEALSTGTRDVDLATLASQTGLPKSTLVRLLQTMRLHQIVQQDPKTRRYRLGWRLVHLGRVAEQQFDIEALMRPLLQELVQGTGETASFAVLDGSKAVYRAQALTTSIIRGVPPVGSNLNLHSTAVGKVLLSSFTEEQFDRFVREHGLPRITDRTVDNAERLRKELDLVREKGFALDDQEAEYGGRCIAAPVFDGAGDVAGAMSITGPTSRIRLELVDEYAQTVMRIAQKASDLLRQEASA
jgi:DNA-binding IclR family transcriptional regulator